VEAGDRLGPYALRREIGEGGIAQVFLAEDTRRHRSSSEVVVKALRDEHFPSTELFLAEPRALQAVEHENTIEVIEVVEDPPPYFVTELLRGRTLAELLKTGPIPIARALGIMRQVAVVLAHAHDVNVVHRNLKPANVFLVREGKRDFVKLLELGAVRMQVNEGKPIPGTVIGTPAYMAPEQLRQTAGDHRVDMYSFGVMMFELAAGRRPFTGELADMIRQHLIVRAPRTRDLKPEVPQPLDDLVAQCLEKDPDSRAQSMHEVSLALGVLADSLGAVALNDEPGRAVAVPKNTSGYTTVVADATIAPVGPSPFDDDEPSFPSVTDVHTLPRKLNATTEENAALGNNADSAEQGASAPRPSVASLLSTPERPSSSPPSSSSSSSPGPILPAAKPRAPDWSTPPSSEAPSPAREPAAKKPPIAAIVVVTALAACAIGLAIGFGAAHGSTPDTSTPTPHDATPATGTPATTAAPTSTPSAPASDAHGDASDETPSSSGTAPTTAVAKKGQDAVDFESTPSGAQVWIRMDRKIRLLCSTPCSFALPTGKEILVELRKDGFKSTERTITVSPSAKVNGTLRAR
jgi:serine/threonine-protein kinase